MAQSHSEAQKGVAIAPQYLPMSIHRGQRDWLNLQSTRFLEIAIAGGRCDLHPGQARMR